ncbi:MAG: endocytosis defective- protein [Phylliscum demangeonii]|nr:MAG: endocytosis defective- protein [Phylliscum demangeonii]
MSQRPTPSPRPAPSPSAASSSSSSPPQRIAQWEVERYWEIFSSLAQGGQHLSGAQAATVLKNSRLADDQLEQVWDLADVDNDGQLDFEEFCVAMRLIFDLVNGEAGVALPRSLPDWLVPQSKAHLVQANRALAGQLQEEEEEEDEEGEEGEEEGEGFDWYMSPADRAQYEAIYGANKDGRGEIRFDRLEPLYAELDVPDADLRAAWKLVTPGAGSGPGACVGKDGALAFFHLLKQRQDGARIPRTLPASLRASLARRPIDYDLAHVAAAAPRPAAQKRSEARAGPGPGPDPDPDTSASASASRKPKFGDTYLSRLGLGGGSTKTSRPTPPPPTTTDAQWEEAQLKRQVAELDAKLQAAEAAVADRQKQRHQPRSSAPTASAPSSRAALIKRELGQLLEYKRERLRVLQQGQQQQGQTTTTTTMKTGGSAALKAIADDVAAVRDQVDGLQSHLAARQAVLSDLRAEIDRPG